MYSKTYKYALTQFKNKKSSPDLGEKNENTASTQMYSKNLPVLISSQRLVYLVNSANEHSVYQHVEFQNPKTQ